MNVTSFEVHHTAEEIDRAVKRGERLVEITDKDAQTLGSMNRQQRREYARSHGLFGNRVITAGDASGVAN